MAQELLFGGDGPVERPDPSDEPLVSVVQGGAPAADGWRVLVFDRDAGVHAELQSILESLEVAGKPLNVQHVTSVDEAQMVLDQRADTAVALLDASWGQGQVGLALARRIRQSGNTDLRLVLRTSASGVVPALGAFERCDIADYVSADELATPRLAVVLSSAIRSFQHIQDAKRATRASRLIAAVSDAMSGQDDPMHLARDLLQAVSELLGWPVDGFVFAEMPDAQGAGRRAGVMAATGRFERIFLRGLDSLDGDLALRRLGLTITSHDGIDGGEEATVMRIDVGQNDTMMAYIEHAQALGSIELDLLRALSACARGHFGRICVDARLRGAAFVDHDTGLPNANLMRTHIDRQLSEADRDEMQLTLVRFADFEAIVGVEGYRRGVEVLKAAYSRLRSVAGVAAVIARLHDDTLAILGRAHPALVTDVGSAFSNPLRVGGRDYTLAPRVSAVDLRMTVSGADEIIATAE